MVSQPHPKMIIALVLSLSAIAAPVANAKFAPPDPPCPGCYTAAGPAASSFDRPAIVRVESSSGFDWADAGIGAAGALALTLTALGITLVVRSTRPRPQPTSARPRPSGL